MNTFAQVRHLLFNDVRRLQWPLVAYAACVLLATVDALSFASRSPGWLGIMPFLVFGAGFFLVASAVQADSPYRPDAFWVSRPIQPVAVLGAKLVLAALVVALPVAGLTWTLVHIGFPSSEYGSTLGRASLDFATWLVAIMAIAAVTHDVRSFSNVFVGLMALSMLGALALLRRSGSTVGLNETATLAASTLFHVGPLAVLTYVYLKRDAVRTARAFGGALVAVWIVLSPFSIPRGYPVVTVKETLRPAEAPQVSLVFDRPLPNDGPEMLRFHVSGKPWRDAARLVVSAKSLLVRARDGTTVNVMRVPALVVPLQDPMPDGASLRDLNAFSSSAVYLGPGELRRLTSGIESIELVGTVEPYAVRIAATLPFTSGAQVQQGGTMYQVDSVQRDPVVSSAVATTVSVRAEPRRLAAENQWSLPRLVLIDGEAHRAITTFGHSSGTASGWIILPGMSVIRSWTKVEARWPLAYAGSAMAPARLMWLDWKSLGQAPVRLRAVRE